ncbi:hypothetical protein PF008_g22690 [Phytophthora fragariae]|uniref:RxLR effector protein n=1 Tax=Phytophthora fragariae TaxID=53985 RepID=A0A6G0QT48_9STRA|nr:hypothetical protein PF008_g22693 [Phytophthora fragariae]KAE9301657.1 hypothetical protein PF008_g22690 [Phytophthora fragariae]
MQATSAAGTFLRWSLFITLSACTCQLSLLCTRSFSSRSSRLVPVIRAGQLRVAHPPRSVRRPTGTPIARLP